LTIKSTSYTTLERPPYCWRPPLVDATSYLCFLKCPSKYSVVKDLDCLSNRQTRTGLRTADLD
jgi:hypothetical protein